MTHRLWSLVGILAASLSPSFSQTPKTAAKTTVAGAKKSTFRTPWGDPDLQGVWNDATSTPLERPGNVNGRNVLSDEEAGDFQAQLEHNLTRDRRDGGADLDVNRAYNEHWMDSRRLKITSDLALRLLWIRRTEGFHR